MSPGLDQVSQWISGSNKLSSTHQRIQPSNYFPSVFMLMLYFLFSHKFPLLMCWRLSTLTNLKPKERNFYLGFKLINPPFCRNRLNGISVQMRLILADRLALHARLLHFFTDFFYQLITPLVWNSLNCSEWPLMRIQTVPFATIEIIALYDFCSHEHV